MLNRKQVLAVLSIVVVVLAGFGVYFYLNKPPSAAKVTLLFDFTIQGRYAPFYAALDQGYYEAEGLSVALVRGQGSIFGITQLSQGKVDFAMLDWSTLILGRNNGTRVKSILQFENHSPAGFSSWNITTAKQLEGRSFGVAPESETRYLLPVWMKLNGADYSKTNVIFITAAAATAGFLQGKYDAYSVYYDSSLPILQKQAAAAGKTVRHVLFANSGMDLYGYNISAGESYINQNPSVVKRFVAATMKGMQYAIDRPNAAVDSMVKLEPALDRETVRQQWVNGIEMMKGTQRMGYTEPARIDTTVKILSDAYGIRSFAIDQAYTNQFLN